MEAFPLKFQVFSELLYNERLLLHVHSLRRAFCCQIIFMSLNKDGTVHEWGRIGFDDRNGDWSMYESRVSGVLICV